MDSLIRITEQDDQQLVSARELYVFLGVKTDFTEWCKRMFDYGFSDGVDFTPILGKSTGGRPSVDYALTLDCAKEISMLQRTERGKQARQYFIEAEKRYRLAVDARSPLDIAEIMLRQLRAQESRMSAVEAQTATLAEQVTEVQAKQTTIDEDYYALAGYYRLQGRRFDLTNAQAQQTGKTLKRKSDELGYTVNRAYSDKYGTVNTYHRFVLQAVLGF